MTAVGNETPLSERETMIVDLVTRITALFARLPMLSGFSVQDRTTLTAEREAVPLDAELSIADVSVHTWPGFPPRPGLPAEIVAALLELLDEHPAARALLRGYTFARVFH
jgi:hypothetical protein